MTHTDTNPRPGQYLTHAHSHITRAVAAMDSCFDLVRPHQLGIAVGHRTTRRPCIRHPLLPKIGIYWQFILFFCSTLRGLPSVSFYDRIFFVMVSFAYLFSYRGQTERACLILCHDGKTLWRQKSLRYIEL